MSLTTPPIYFKGTTKYPEDKEIAGRSYWGTMHNAAARLKPGLNDVLTPEEIRTFHQWLLYTAAHFVCDMCNITPWLQEHQITGNKRVDMERYVCRMHNYVNEKTGKMLHDCTTIHEEKECHSCKYQNQLESINKISMPMNDTKTPAVSITPDVNSMNEARKKIFERLCEREGIPVPVIRFAKCPQAPFESCVVPNEDVTKSEVYLDPDPVRSIAHEFNHYAKRYKGDIAGAYNEYEIDKEAQALVEKELGNQLPELKPITVPAMHDTKMEVHAPTKDTSPPDRMESIMKRFPMYAKRLKEAEEQKRRDHSTSYQSNTEMESVRESRGTGGGFLGGLDGVFKPFADMIGIPAHTANTMHMSNTIGYVVNMIVQTTSSPFGASVASFFGSLLLFMAGAFGKGDIGQEDRKILFGIVSNIFNNNIALLGNARTRESIMRSANMAGYALSRLDFDMLIKTLTMDPSQLSGMTAQSREGYGLAPGNTQYTPNPTGGGYGVSPPVASTAPGGYDMPVPTGGGIDTRFQLEGPLRNKQGETFEQAVARRRPTYNQSYTPPLDVPPGYGGIPELADDMSDAGDNMNVVGGGIDSLPEIDFGLRGGVQQRRTPATYPVEEDYGF